jgi:hypothetical protein
MRIYPGKDNGLIADDNLNQPERDNDFTSDETKEIFKWKKQNDSSKTPALWLICFC